MFLQGEKKHEKGFRAWRNLRNSVENLCNLKGVKICKSLFGERKKNSKSFNSALAYLRIWYDFLSLEAVGVEGCVGGGVCWWREKRFWEFGEIGYNVFMS